MRIFAIAFNIIFMKKLFVLVVNLFLCLCFLNAQNNVIDPQLEKILNQGNDDYIDINIIFKSQMSTAELAVLNCKSDSKETRREIVINELKKFSEKSQKDVMSVIKAEERSINVIDIKSHWITNFINCKAKADVIYQLASHPDIVSICHNAKDDVHCGVTTSTEEIRSTQAATANIAQHVTQVRADKVWDLGYTGKGVVVAVLDTGVNTEHADIKNNLWNGNLQHGYNVVSPGLRPSDHSGHGTHCAGIIAGDGTSGTMTGIAPDAQVMCIKTHDASGLSLSQLITGIEWAADNGADILSISLGFMYTSTAINDAGRAAIRSTFEKLLDMDIVAVVASGNEGNQISNLSVPNNVRTPGNCPPPWIHPDQQANAGGKSSVISVGAVDDNNAIAALSAYGPVTWQHISGYNDYPYNPGIGLIRPDICAPGHPIYSLDNSTSGYVIKSGTSQATPCVAGVLALMLEKRPDLTPADLCRIIETTASNKPATKSNRMGSGIIDALAAVQAVNFNTSDPVINLYSFSRNLTAGSNLNFELSFINNGGGASSANANVTISTNDAYTTIVTGSKNYSSMAADATATATFVINIDPLVPDNHIVELTANGFGKTYNVKIKISNEFVAPSLTAQADGTSVNLSWNATNNATSYNIYRNGAFLTNTTLTSYTDAGLEYGTLYAYTVTSKRGELESEHSLIARAQTEDNPNKPSPTNVKANNGVVTWTNGADSKGSNIYRKDINTNVETNLASNINGTSYTDNDWNSLANSVYQYGVSNTYSVNEKIYEEGFEGNNNWTFYNEGWTYSATDWKIANKSTLGQTFTACGSNSAFFSSSAKKDTYLSYLVSPMFDFTEHNGNSVKLSFYYITPSWSGDVNTLKVMISTTSNTGPWTQLWTNNKVDASDWTEVKGINLSEYVGQQFYIAFLNIAGAGYCSGVDNIIISVEGNSESRIEWSDNLCKNVNIFVQDGLWTNTDNWAAKRLPNENDSQVIINANATIASGDVTVNSLVINEGASLTLNDSVILTVNDDFINTDVDAFIINDGAQVFQNNDDLAATFNMNITNPGDWTSNHNNGWQFIASPVKGAKTEDFVPTYSDYDLYKFDGSKRLSWLNHKDENIYDEEPEEPEDVTIDTITIGEGNITQMSAPIYNASGGSYSLSQQIYTKEEIGIDKGGYIKSISFHHNTGNNNTRNIVVYLQNTEKETFNDSYDWITISDADIVYQGEYTFGKKDDWVTIEFPNAFEYTGKNLAIIVYDKTGTNYSYTYEICDKFYSSQTNTLRGKYIFKTSEINISQLSTYYGSNMTTGRWSSPPNAHYINNIRLTVASSVAKNRANNITYELSKFETEFQQGIGYLVSYENEAIASFKGTLHHEKSYQFDVTYNSSNDNANFHLLGNPFAFNMNWDKINITNIVNGYAVINENGGYEYHADGEINVGDGFLVRTIGTNPTIEYKHNTRRNDDENKFINVIASGKNGNDNVILRLSGEEKGFPKIQNFNKDIAVIYVSDDNNNYGICNYDSDIEEVELSFIATQIGDYNIHIDANGNFDNIILKDLITGVETDMLTASYSFKSSSQDNGKRFLLKFSTIEDDDIQYIFAYKSGEELIIKDQGIIQIIDMMGRIVYSNDVIQDNDRIDISKLDKTAYIIRLTNEKGVWTQKIVVY